MRCIELKHGRLVAAHRPVRAPAPGEVLIRIAAAGVNRPDILQRDGLYPPPAGDSDILGLECAGEIESLGEGVTQWVPGEAVCALLNGGGYAQYVTVPAGQCLRVPNALNMIQAASLPETYFTVWSNLFDRARLQPGESLLVHGGTSGIGVAAIQIASRLGVHVMTTARSDEKCRVCRDLGAEVALNYHREDFVPTAREFGAKNGVDVILDMVGGDYIARNIKALAPDGRLVNIAFQNGSRADIDFMAIMLKRLTISGSTLRARSPAFKAAIADKLKTHVWPLLERGDIRPVVHATFPLEHADEALRAMESGGHIGKIILTVS